MKSGMLAGIIRRSVGVLAFALLFASVSAIPVFAEGETVPTDPPAAGGLPALSDEAPLASGLTDEALLSAELADGYADYRDELAQRDAELQTPTFVDERARSKHAYADLEPDQAEELLQLLFGDVLEGLNKDPARFLSDAKIDHVAEVDAATVTSEGDSQLFEAGVPVRTEDDEGDLSKVDVSLEKTAEGWEPANPLVEVQVGTSVEEGIEVGDKGVTVTQLGAEDSIARPMGDKNLFFSEVEEGTDTDLMVSPTTTGVELFDLLRSVDSSEVLRFKIAVPAGSELRPNEGGGAQIVDAAGETSVLIPPPWARDAQGTSVPVTTQVEGDMLVLGVQHRDLDLAYPILVDPTIYQDWGWWYSGQHLSGLPAWSWNQTGGNWWVNHGYTESAWPGYSGLAIASAPGNLPGGHWGQWSYSAPNAGSYLADATINPFFRSNRTCSAPNPYSEPYDYVGMWNETSYNRLLYNNANSQGWSNLQSWGRALIIGMGTANGINIPCWRDLLVGGVGIWLDDWQYPYLDSVGATPEGWVKRDGTARTFSVSASDAGLGVRTVRMVGVGTQEWFWNKAWCAGTYEQRCPTAESGQITFKTEGFPYEGRYDGEGKERKFSVQVIDPTDKRWQLERPLWLDGTPSVISLKGQLATITKQVGSKENQQDEVGDNDELSLPTYKLEIEADDGADRSGVKEIKVFLDGKSTPEEVKLGSCSVSCPQKLAMNYTLKPGGLAPGSHSLRIITIDKVGNESDPNRDILFEYIPATGMKEEYVLQHFRLPDGKTYPGEVEYHGPEIAVNVMNGNAVFHERDIDIETDSADVELERIYNSQQPTQKDTQWGRGWSLAQAPELEPQPGSNPPQKATIMETGEITNSVPIPQTQSQSIFSSKLHATITKTAGGYEVEPAAESEVSVFSSSGRIDEVVLGDNTPAYLDPEEGEPSPPTPPTYASAFGSVGTATGQFKHPAGIAVDGAGNVWVVDQDNDRVQKFNSAGQFQSSFGTPGTGDGQFGRPTDIAIDIAGNLWVADAGNSRVQKFNAAGQFLAKYGSQGSGDGQFNGAESIAIDSKGNIWVGDTYNARLQKFSSSFAFIAKYGTYGSGQGQLIEPTGIDIGPGDKVWVAEWGNNRVSVFGENGEFVRQFGAAGTGNGQFNKPDVIEVDAKGNVWVGDQNNGRVQQFNQSGEYVAQFGTKGTGAGQFTFGWPMGVASDSKGNLWISDTSNNRVQRWSAADSIGGTGGGGPAPYFAAPVVDYEYSEGKLTGLQLKDEETQGEDPSLDMSLSAGLVSGVESEEGGDVAYGYESGKLKAAGDKDGETKYGYDSAGRLNSVTLANGTTASITYDTTSRATSVKVDPAGPEVAKTTNFFYSAEPRRTTVWGGGNPEITYDIGEDGSVLKWAYAETPPTIASISGSLWSKRGQEIENKDHTLFVTGSSPHQVASIQIVANGTAVVAEKTCEDPSAPPSHICDQPAPLEWITNAAAHAAGRMDLEVIVTDFLGHQVAERFFVTVPQQPPPDPEAPEPPSFDSIKLFREENGLDRNKSLTSPQMNELILGLLYDWERRDETAMRAVESFGVPMRAPELAEMEYRRSYLAQAAEVIPQWGEENAPSTYGGYYVDNRAGGVIYVGFTENQHNQLETLKQSGLLMATGQVTEMPTPPTRSIASVEATEASVMQFVIGNAPVAAATTSISTSAQSGAIEVTATNPGFVQQQLTIQFGPTAPIVVTADTTPVRVSRDRFNIEGPVVAGDYLVGSTGNQCTAAFSADNRVGTLRGQPVFAFYKMTAGHCFNLLESVSRRSRRVGGDTKSVGKVKLSGWSHANSNNNYTDVEMIEVNGPLAGGGIFTGNPHHLFSPNGTDNARLNREYCWSGFNGGKHCGTSFKRVRLKIVPENKWEIVMAVAGANVSGDSGGPVWDPKTGMLVGIVSAHSASQKIPCRVVTRPGSLDPEWCPLNYFAPLRPFAGKSYPDGALKVVGDPELLLIP